MTERHAGYLVVLDDDIREDDAEAVVNAIRMIKRVQAVRPVTATPELQIAQTMAEIKIRQRLWAVLHSEDDG